MVFNSLLFLIFFCIVLSLYWTIPKRFQWIWLLLASYYFYVSWNPAHSLILFLVTVVSYVSAIAIEKNRKQKNLYAVLALMIVFGTLFIFKYFGFFSYSLSSLLQAAGTSIQIPTFDLLLPIGISFFTFQTAGYLIDVYRGTQKAEKDFGMFALFVSFFPQIVSGPIERANHLLPQLKKEHAFEYPRAASGLKLLTLGLFKKVVIADNLALTVNSVFSSVEEYKGLSLIITMILFSWQMYADFSGYTDMARGVARILGFDLFENFKTPYFATSVRDFWRRWHISLSSWFKDYLYIPLGGSRGGLWRTCLNNFLVFFICGLWHGASWNFAIWGMLHGVMISVERIVEQLTQNKLRIPIILSIVSTYTLITASWIFFRAETFAQALYILRYSLSGIKNIFSPNYIWATLSQLFNTNILEMGIILTCLGIIVLLDIVSRKKPLGLLVSQQPTMIRWSLYIAVVTVIVLFRNMEVTEFIYLQF